MINKNKPKGDKYEIAYAVSLITQIGVTVSVITISLIWFGYWMDVRFGALPIFVISGAVLAFIFSMYAVYRLVLPVTGVEKNHLKKDE